jgi:parallel beta-helix repeat protein
MNDYGINISYSDNNTITNNDCIFISNYGINVFNSNNNTIDNNNCSNSANGIYLEYSKNNSITNNKLYSVNNVGMWLVKSKNNTLFNNTVFANFAGFQIFFDSDNNTIMNNTSPTGTVGLYIGMSSNNTCINNNWSSHSAVNVYLLMGSNNNTLINNKCDNSQFAIVLQDSSYNIIEDNNCQSTLSYGIYLISPSSYNIIQNNDLRNTDGILLFGIWNTIIGNTIEVNKPAVHGIMVQPTSHNSSIFNNQITTQADGAMGIYSLANNDMEFKNNIIKTFGNRSFGMFLGNGFRMTHRNNNINVYGRETAGMIIQNCEGNIYGSKIKSWGMDSPSVTIVMSNVNFYSAMVQSINNVSFNLSVNSEVIAQTCNFNPVNVLHNDLTSNLTVINSLRISVNYSAPYFTPVPDVEVNVTNNGQIVYRTPGYNGTDKKTNMNGKTSGILVLSHKYIWSESATYYPTNIELKKDIQGRHWDDVRNNIDMTTSHIEYFEPDIDIAAPLPPENIVATSFPDGQALKLTWDDVPNVNLYRLYWNDTGDVDGSFVEIQQVNSNTSDVLDLIDYQPYALKIQCRDISGLWGDLSLSEAVIGIPMDTQPPATPTGLTIASRTSKFINITWDTNTEPDLEGYAVHRVTESRAIPIFAITNNNWFNDTTIEENRNYTYLVSAFDEVPNYSPPSDPANTGIIPILPPKIIDRKPGVGETGVPISTMIEITFSKSMVQESVMGAFDIAPVVEGTFEWSGDGKTVKFVPTEKLAYLTDYTITIGTGAKDKKFGYGLVSESKWSFTTERDLYPPTILDYGPTGSQVRVTSIIFVEFSETMDKDSTEGAFLLTPDINGTFTWEGNLMVFTPNTPLEYNTTYKVEIGTSAKDTADNSIGAHNWEFTTLNATSSPPEIIGHSPIGSDIPVDTEVKVEFLKPMNKKATQTAFSISPSVPGGKFSWDGNELIFNHADFKTNTTYTVTIRTTAMDTDSNRMPAEFTWEFTTSEIGIYRPPKIIAISPEPNSEVEINTKIRITFNKAITNDLATLNIRKIGADLLNGTVEFNDAKTEISFILPAGKYLDYSSNYYMSFIGMEIDTGSFNLSVGNLTYSWEFSTKSEGESDSDNDNMDDEWENDNGLNPFNKNDATGDLDSDDLNNLAEYEHKTDPNNNDSDSDGLEDGLEVTLYLTDPADSDSDDDDWTDGAEVEAGTNPLDADDHPVKKKKKGDEPALLLILAIIIIIVIIVIIALMLMLRARKPKQKPKASKEVQQKQKNEDIKKKIKGDAQNEPEMNRK